MNKNQPVKPYNNISMIGITGENRELGKDNGLIWDIPEDLKWFKNKTEGKVVIMGRKTYESLGRKPLPNRTNIVLSRRERYKGDKGIVVLGSIKEAIEEFKNYSEILIMGGAEIYEIGLPYVSRLYMTEVEAVYEDADAYFPKLDFDEWYLVHHERKETKDGLGYSLNIFNRKEK